MLHGGYTISQSQKTQSRKSRNVHDVRNREAVFNALKRGNSMHPPRSVRGRINFLHFDEEERKLCPSQLSHKPHLNAKHAKLMWPASRVRSTTTHTTARDSWHSRKENENNSTSFCIRIWAALNSNAHAENWAQVGCSDNWTTKPVDRTHCVSTTEIIYSIAAVKYALKTAVG